MMRTRIQRYLIIVTCPPSDAFFLSLLMLCLVPPARLPTIVRPLLQSTLANINLRSRGRDPSKRNSLAIRQVIQRRLRNVESRGRVVDGQHVDGSAIVAELPACATLLSDVSLCLFLDMTRIQCVDDIRWGCYSLESRRRRQRRGTWGSGLALSSRSESRGRWCRLSRTLR